MQFGIFVATKIDDWQLIKYAEDLGYDRAWVPDSQMIWSDCYATLALAPVNTKRIQLGPRVLAMNMAAVEDGAQRAGRELPKNFHTAALTSAVVLKPGEKVDSERVVAQCGSQVAAVLHFAYEIVKLTKNEGAIPHGFEEVWGAYCKYVEEMKTPAEKRYQQLHNGPCTFLMPEERRFVTEETIRASILVGTPEELTDRIRESEKPGLKEI